MKIFSNLIISILFAAWIGFIAVFSIQNITDVSLKFIVFESIKLPVGVLLSFCAGIGMTLGGILPFFFLSTKKSNRRKSLEDEVGF